jgi:hypothetical protein
MSAQRFFEVTITDKWRETKLNYEHGENHKEVAARLEFKNKRVLNQRFREIEQTGKYYRITEQVKAGKAFIFEITNQ